MRSGMTAGVVLAALVMVTAPAAAAHAASTPTGNDVSYPQCGQALPSGQAFGVVAVNEETGEPRPGLPCSVAQEGRHAIAERGPAVSSGCRGGLLEQAPQLLDVAAFGAFGPD
jgi:hypothetical protein